MGELIWYSTDATKRLSFEPTAPHHLPRPREARAAAEEAASAYYYSCHYGQLVAVDITLYESETGPAIGRYHVEIDMVPEFSAVEEET